LYKSLKYIKLKITPTCFGSYAIHHPGSTELYLTEIHSGSLMFVVCLVGVWQRNFWTSCMCLLCDGLGTTQFPVPSPSYSKHTTG